MIGTVRRWAGAAAGAMLAIAGSDAGAQANAGQFLTAVGDVRVVAADGAQRTPQRGTILREGETILTGAGALAQVRLLDGGLLSVRADTEMKIDRFAHAGQDDRNSSLLISLLKGGFRSITGLIGQLNRDGYRITTPTATIGIRGTDHEPVVVLPGAIAAQLQVPPGTYDRVYAGQTIIQNPQGQSQLVNPNQIGFISVLGAAPVILPALPPIYRSPTPAPQTGLPPQQAGPAGAARPDDGKGAAPGAAGLRQLSPGAREAIGTTPLEGTRPGATTTIQQTAPVLSPPQTAPTTIQQTAPVLSPIQTAPTTIQTAPALSPTQTAPTIQQTAPIQTAPLQTSPLQTSPVLKAPTAPVLRP